ncbi:MAG TPA: DNA gyrase inhibitor YacG [Myxococcales bacterium]|nr:DNA gyrase inhibitor YacG [Myxococcales bacterium]
MQRCPSCRGPVKPREQNESYPFCSARCRAVDLARWFTGSYRVPGAPAPSPSQEGPPKDSDGEQ